MKIIDIQVRRYLLVLVIVSVIIRAFLAFWLEFGNDEVYYVLYALFPDWSHFDHPPMIGWMMQITSLNLQLNHEFFLRLSSVIFMTFNTFIIFNIGKLIKNERTGLYAAILYNTSIYSGIITGVFILPDTPQNLFWIWSMWLIFNIFKEDTITKSAQNKLLLLGLTIGLGMISKYTSVFLWIGVIGYIIFNDKRWLKQSYLYISLIISLLVLFPVIYWNYSNDFISFGFHAGRVAMYGKSIRFDYFLTELVGEIMYCNPINYAIILLAIYALFKGKIQMHQIDKRLLFWIGFPLIFTFLFFSIFRATLPHWSGPGYNALIMMGAVWLENQNRLKFPVLLKASIFLIIIVIVIGSLQINFGIIPVNDQSPYHRIGKDDITLDMYGWRELKPAFESTRNRLIEEGKMGRDCAIVGDNWFPLANFDYYIAQPMGMKVYGLGELEKIHKYLWINKIDIGLQAGKDYWFLTTSRDFKDPDAIYGQQFEQIISSDTINIERGGKPVKRVFVFLLKGLK